MSEKYVDYVEFVNTHKMKNVDADEGDVLAYICIDGYPKYDNECGGVVAVVYITLKGDIVISWHDNRYRYNRNVEGLIADSIKQLKKFKEFGVWR